jgi:hypothetical protein
MLMLMVRRRRRCVRDHLRSCLHFFVLCCSVLFYCCDVLVSLIALSGVVLSLTSPVSALIGGVLHRVEVLVTGVDELFALLLGSCVDLFVIRVKLFVVLLCDIVDDIDDVGDMIRDGSGGNSSSCGSGGGRDSAPARRNGDGSCSRYYRD